MKQAMINGIKELVVLAILVAIMFVFAKPSIIYGESMLPTLEHLQVVVAERFSLMSKPLQVGEIVIVKTDKPLFLGLKKNFIKRVIAVSGDKLFIGDYQVYRNGQMLKEDYILDGVTPGDFEGVIPENHVYVMGDNRRNSEDSRIIGPVPTDRIIGRVYFRLWPFTLY